ncbi:MspA family porin [Nocardia sp. NPDC059239]|uniref:MspA family porin n=1 Tax=Nocardia sp. NPDC059239 TaxID=3346785 RepID=UPI0036B2AC3A
MAAALSSSSLFVPVFVSTTPASADTFVPLPDGQKQGPNGVVVTRTGERATISPSLADNGAGRTVWVSGNAIADVPDTPETKPGPWNGPNNAAGSNNSSTHGSSIIDTGYIVGCQVNIASDATSAGVSGSLNLSGGSVGGSVGLKLGPGQVAFVEIDSKDITKPGHYSVEYQDVQMQIQNCAGYAQARAYTVVEIVGDHYSKTTLYGQPFSIG